MLSAIAWAEACYMAKSEISISPRSPNKHEQMDFRSWPIINKQGYFLRFQWYANELYRKKPLHSRKQGEEFTKCDLGDAPQFLYKLPLLSRRPGMQKLERKTFVHFQ
jgi:hypothetical protein